MSGCTLRLRTTAGKGLWVVKQLEPLWDVDTPEELSRLRTLAGGGHLVHARR